MGQDAVPGLRLRLGNGLVRLRHLLQVVDAGGQRVDVALSGADLEHVQNYLGVFGIVLVPAIMQRLTRPCQGDRRNQAQLETRS
ncbi:Uncharacterised protein [Mycobacterium tuberculosis]|nr:Uncharacterised protein [Mycobacterium tuberculosis]